jgi:hypothetical protein
VSVVPAVAVYDEVHQSAVVVRGTKTSTWNGATWMDDAFASPDVATPQMAYVSGLGVVLVGSITVTAGSVRSPVHLFVHDGGGWVDRGPGPPERTAAAVGYDPVSRQVVVFGGYTKGGTRQVSLPLNDTWVWDVATGAWSEVFPIVRPPSRSGASLAWDRARGRLALVQGAMTVWEWDRARVSWHPILTAGSPEPVTTSLAVSAPDGDGLVVGGTVAHAGASSVGLYRLKWSGPGPLESCEGGQDLDRDGLAGCDDPDCEVACARAALTCGNAVCEDTESCGLCPQDCGTCRERCGDFTCSSVETAETCPGDCTVMP